MNIHIPTYDEVDDKVVNTFEKLNPIELFIGRHEPRGEKQEQFRADLHSLIQYVQESGKEGGK